MIEFKQDEINVEEQKVRGALTNRINDLEEKIRAYTGVRTFGPTENRVYNALLDCFILHSLARKKISTVIPSPENSLWVALYAMNIGARYGLKSLEEQISTKRVKLRSPDDNIFFRECELDISAPYPRLYNSALEDLSRILGNGCTKDLADLARDYFRFLIASTQKLCQNERAGPLIRAVNSNPVRYKNVVFNDLSAPIRMQEKKDGPVLTWEDLVGQDEAKNYLQGYELFFRNLDFALSYNDLLGLFPNILMIGPPGVGKTRSAQILSQRCSIPFREISMKDISDTYKDGASMKLADEFDNAIAPIKSGLSRLSMMFIDEFDSVGKRRYDKNSSGEDTKVTETLLVYTGRGNQQPGLIVCAASNFLFDEKSGGSIISDAVLNRFHVLRYSLPDESSQAKLYRYFLDSKKKQGIYNGVNFQQVAKTAFYPGSNERFSGRTIHTIVDLAINLQIKKGINGGNTYTPISTENITEQNIAHARSRPWYGTGGHT